MLRFWKEKRQSLASCASSMQGKCTSSLQGSSSYNENYNNERKSCGMEVWRSSSRFLVLISASAAESSLSIILPADVESASTQHRVAFRLIFWLISEKPSFDGHDLSLQLNKIIRPGLDWAIAIVAIHRQDNWSLLREEVASTNKHGNGAYQQRSNTFRTQAPAPLHTLTLVSLFLVEQPESGCGRNLVG